MIGNFQDFVTPFALEVLPAERAKMIGKCLDAAILFGALNRDLLALQARDRGATLESLYSKKIDEIKLIR